MTERIDGKSPAASGTRGRPRTEGLEERVLDATRRVVSEHGYAAATVDQIAEAASVSKGSIYRRWPTKGVLVYDACLASTDTLAGIIDSGDVRADLTAVALLTSRSFRTKSRRELLNQILADAARDEYLMELLRTRFFAPRSDAIVRRVQLAIDRGEVRGDLNVALVPAIINGSQQYVLGVRGRALSDAEVSDLVDMILGPRIVDPDAR